MEDLIELSYRRPPSKKIIMGSIVKVIKVPKKYQKLEKFLDKTGVVTGLTWSKFFEISFEEGVGHFSSPELELQ